MQVEEETSTEVSQLTSEQKEEEEEGEYGFNDAFDDGSDAEEQEQDDVRGPVGASSPLSDDDGEFFDD